MSFWKVVNTDNFDGDYPNEKFVENVPQMNESEARSLATLLCSFVPEDHARHWTAVPADYQLQPGFEP